MMIKSVTTVTYSCDRCAMESTYADHEDPYLPENWLRMLFRSPGGESEVYEFCQPCIEKIKDVCFPN